MSRRLYITQSDLQIFDLKIMISAAVEYEKYTCKSYIWF